MKKILYSIMACGVMVALASCQNQDEPAVPAVDNLASTFPKGSVPKEITVEIPGDVRTRADFEASLPLWDVNQSSNSGLITVRYGVYHADGSLYYSTDDASSLVTTKNARFSFSIPVPADESGMKLFVWADKSGGKAYKIDWNAKKVSANPSDESSKQLYKNFACDGDAFYTYRDVPNIPNNASSTISLNRPFVQVNILTDELNDKAVAESFLHNDSSVGIGSYFGLYSSNPDRIYIPSAWYWETDEFDFAEYSPSNGVAPNYCFLSGNPTSGRVLPGLTSVTAPTGTINGKSKMYFGVFYFFAPKTRKAWKQKGTNTVLSAFYARMLNGDETHNTSNIAIMGSMPDMQANERLVLHNSDGGNDDGGSGGSGGILTENVSFTGLIMGGYSGTSEL